MENFGGIMTEKEAWKHIKKIEDFYMHDRIQRIENLTADGMPDINGCIDGKEFWLELKCPRIPKRKETPLFGSNHKIMPNQFAWMKKQTLAGGKCGVLICMDDYTIFVNGNTIDSSILKMNIEEIKFGKFNVFFTPQSIKDSWLYIREYIKMYL